MEKEEFERLLKICRLSLKDEEKEKLRKQIEEVIEKYFDKIESVNCDEPPAYHPIEIPGKLREDEPKQFDNIVGLLKNTKTFRGYVISPKV
jgi:aspartyl/glutamyl-tRNA(Asn/Gln) amidotransferase C subunit